MTKQIKYIINRKARICGPRNFLLKPEAIELSVHRTRKLIDKLSQSEVDVFSLLGMRNLSSFVGEVFAASMILENPKVLRKNPHQDGYPDLLLMDESGNKRWSELVSSLRDKSPFSPFKTGGFEVKATCGSVPTPAECKRHEVEKPDIGDQRVELLKSYDWKAHHRETNYLFGLVWDFIGGCPTVVAVFYRSDLNTGTWGEIVQPKEGGGRTTSVSIMARQGVQKMYEGWIAVIDSEEYVNFLDKYNRGSLLSEARNQLRRSS